MPDALATYRTRTSGLFGTRHEISNDEGPLGEIVMEREKGLVVRGRYQPKSGELLLIRRDPGILRSQFSLWTEGREWLGSSLRSSFFGRAVDISTGNKPYRLLPSPSLARGWNVYAPKTGQVAKLEPLGLGRGSRIEVYRRIDFELVVFAYFVGVQIYWESLWPGREVLDDLESLPAASSKS